MTLPGPMLFVMDSGLASSSPNGAAASAQRPMSKIGPRMTRYRYGMLDLPPPPPPSMPLPEPPRAPSREHFPHVPAPAAPPPRPPPTDPLPELPPTRPNRSTYRPPAPAPNTPQVSTVAAEGSAVPKELRRRSRSLGALASMQPQTSSHPDLAVGRPQPVRANTDAPAPLSRQQATSVNDQARVPTPISRSQSPMPTAQGPEQGDHPHHAAEKKSLRTVRRMSRSLSHLREYQHDAEHHHILDITPLPHFSSHLRGHLRRPSTAEGAGVSRSHDGGADVASRSLLSSSNNHTSDKSATRDVAAPSHLESNVHPSTRESRPPVNHSRKTTLFRLEEDPWLHRGNKPDDSQQHPADPSAADAALAARDDSAVRQRVLPPTLRRVSRSFTNLRVLATRDSLQAEDQTKRLLKERITDRHPELRLVIPAPSPDYTQMMSQPRKAPAPPPPAPPVHAQSKFASATKAAFSHLMHSKPASTASTKQSPPKQPRLPPKPAPIGEQPVPASRTANKGGSRILSVAAISRMKAMSPATMMSTFAPLSRPASRDSVSTSESQSSQSQSSHLTKSSITSASSSGSTSSLDRSLRTPPGSTPTRASPQSKTRTASRTREITASPVDPVTAPNRDGNRVSFLAPAMVKPYMGRRF